VRSGKQFLQKIGGHAKKKSGDVAAETAANVANAANDVVDTSLVAGKDLVSNNTRAVTSSVGREVRGVGQSLTVGGGDAGLEDPPDLSKALKQGRVVLRQLRFFEGSAALDPVSNSLVSLLAGAIVANPGNYLLEVHVDPGFDASQAQTLSEGRAAALKQSLMVAGAPGDRVAAVGLGATKPSPKPLGPGAPSTSARVEVSRL
jgi:outer membrane protein OmpA-like peptidoglycan-associated protein